MNKAIVLLSGGLDSATTLYYARSKKFVPHCLIFDYSQRHRKEVRKAVEIAQYSKSPHVTVKMDLPWQGSALLDKNVPLPQNRTIIPQEIPATYVPARNIIFLSYAASYAEAVGASHVFIGANAVDYSGYPDCRPDFFDAFADVLKKGLKTGVEGKRIRIQVPFLKKTKAQIIRFGMRHEVPYHLTWSCYKGGRRPCGVCDSCVLRARGFEQVKTQDPLLTH